MNIMHLPALSVGLILLALTTACAGNVAAQERSKNSLSLSERQALVGQERSVGSLGPGVTPEPSGASKLFMDGNLSQQGSAGSQPSTEASDPEKIAKAQSWLVSASGWYIAALLAMVGMLISSLVAYRIRIERDAARLANTLKTDFLAHVSHEIRTPMNAILGFSQILKDQLHDERHQQYISAITISGNTLLRLINDLLDLAKIEAGKFELQPTAIALKSIALEIQTIFMQIVEDKHLEFVVDLDSALPDSLYLDEVRLRQILFNLLKNAVKFTDKGRISLSMRALAVPGAEAFDLQIIVTDTGIGIPPEEQKRIFEPFTQRKSQDNSKYAGTGLGLSITKRLVEMNGGEISVRSEVGKGSTFTAVLRKIPVAPPHLSTPSKNGGGESAIRFDEEAVILIIDAVDASRMVIREFLRATKIATVETISVADGIDWCMAIKPDLILLDYKRSYLSDPTLVTRFNRVKEEMNIPIVAVLSSSAVGSEEFQTDFHFDGWLKKPLILAEVMETLARFLPHSTLFQPDHSSAFADLRAGYVMPEARHVQQATRKLEGRQSSLMRILVDNMMVQWKENQEIFIVNEIKTFAQEIQRLSMAYGLDFLGLWAAEVLSQIRTFDMERLPDTFKLFPELVAMIEKAHQPDKSSN